MVLQKCFTNSYQKESLKDKEEKMQEEVNKLIKVLKKQVHLYEKLEKLCEEEEKAIVNGDLKKIESIVKEEENVFVQMRLWEKLRFNLIKIIKKKLSIPDDTQFSQVIEKIKGPSSSELEKLRDYIISKITAINELNRKNISLIEYSIKLIDSYFHRLTGTETTSVYTYQGKVNIAEQKRKLLNRIS